MFDANKTCDVEGPSKEKYEVSAPRNTIPSDIVEFVKQHPRKLAVIMHRIWVDGTEFWWTREPATTAA
jgi:hypothetical protein